MRWWRTIRDWWNRTIWRTARLCDARTVTGQLTLYLTHATLPRQDCVVVITVPADDWAWWNRHEEAFRQWYCDGLRSVAASARRDFGPPVPQIRIAPGPRWNLSARLLTAAPTTAPAPKHDCHGYLVVSDRISPVVVPWRHPLPPREPVASDAPGGREALRRTLEAFSPVKSGENPWPARAVYRVCGHDVLYWPAEVPARRQDTEERP